MSFRPATAAPSGGGGGAWGTISGTVSDQTDLQAALDAIVAGGGGIANRLDITGLTGGTSVDLDSIETVGVSVPFGAIINPGATGAQLWNLEAGTDAEDGVGVVRPDDYAATTNEKVWKRWL